MKGMKLWRRIIFLLKILKNLEKQISEKGLNETLFRVCRQFYLTYPQIHSTVSNEFELVDFGNCSTSSNEFVTKPEVLVDNQLFVSTYMLHLPDKRKLQEFMLKEMEKMGI